MFNCIMYLIFRPQNTDLIVRARQRITGAADGKQKVVVGGGASHYCNVWQGSLSKHRLQSRKAWLWIQASNGPSFIRRDLFNNSLSYWMCKHFLLNLFNWTLNSGHKNFFEKDKLLIQKGVNSTRINYLKYNYIFVLMGFWLKNRNSEF